MDALTGRANATLLMLARNRDIAGVEQSMRSLEAQFNSKYNYPWVFLNEEPFTEDFQQRVSALTGAKVEFGLIPHDNWFQPEWIDEERVQNGKDELKKIVKPEIPYANSTSYRNMCRFYSGVSGGTDVFLDLSNGILQVLS